MADLYETVKLGTVAGLEDTAAIRRWLIAGAADYLAREELHGIDDAALFRRMHAAIHAGTTLVEAATSGQIGEAPVSGLELQALRSSMYDMSGALMDEIAARDAEDEEVIAGAVISRREALLQFAAQQYPQLFDPEDISAYEESGLNLGVSLDQRAGYLPQSAPAAPTTA